jgi:hypothetical protein
MTVDDAGHPHGWSALATPGEDLRERWRRAPLRATALRQCDAQWDAVVIPPLPRGLATLDILGLGLGDGYCVHADYLRRELIVQTLVGTARACADVPGVRVLPRGSWLLIAAEPPGTPAAAWLSGPAHGVPARYVDGGDLRDALRLVAVAAAGCRTPGGGRSEAARPGDC